jgi:hypothetical protein
MEKKKANTDTTYCKSESCPNKCWRHIWNWKFDSDTDYWMMDRCKEEDTRLKKIYKQEAK